jgi:hypothetical protein
MQSVVFVACACLLGACSWNFDGNAPELPLVGEPPSLTSLQKLNDGPVYSSAIVYGTDRNFWLSLQEETKKLRVMRLSGTPAQFTVEGDQFVVAWRAFFTWQNGQAPADPTMARPAKLQVLSAGQTSSQAQVFDFPLGIGQVKPGGADDVFVYVPAFAAADSYELVRRDGHRRTIPYPDDGVHPKAYPDGFFSGDGHVFFSRGPCQTGCLTDPNDSDLGGTERRPLVAHSTDAEVDIDLGPQPRRVFLFEPAGLPRRFITCSDQGIKLIPVDPADPLPTIHLDDSRCATDALTTLRLPIPGGPRQSVVAASGGLSTWLYYSIAGELRRVPIDGFSAPERVLDHDVARVLQIFGADLISYSQDSSDRYIYGVGDGWIGDWRFMERGRAANLSIDKKKMFFLENAAQQGGIGTLTSAPLNGTAVPLARNVYQYDELDDGRLLASSNHAFRGTQNRIITIDEARGEARWVVDQAAQYSFIPGSSDGSVDLLVDIVTGASSYDLMRVPLPPRVPLDAGQ